MTKTLHVLAAALLLAVHAIGFAQTAIVPREDHAALLASPDPKLAANKRLAYDFFREVFEAGHMDLASKYLTEGYIQHNPNVPDGRQGFVDVFSKIAKTKPIEDRLKMPLVAITAEGDLVNLVFMRTYPDPKAEGKTYTTGWFDLFRIENGKIAEHWDGALKR